MNAKPLSSHPGDALGRRRIEIRKYHEIVISQETPFDDSVDAA